MAANLHFIKLNLVTDAAPVSLQTCILKSLVASQFADSKP